MILSPNDFAWSLGIPEADLPKECLELIHSADFRYTVLEGAKDAAVLAAMKRIDNDTQIVATPERTQVWQNGWNENLQNFINSGYDPDSLIPKYYRRDVPMRWKQAFIKSPNPMFEHDFFKIVRHWMFRTYLSEAETIYEFGCGSGQNLVAAATMFPDKNIWGLDFVHSAIEIVNLLKDKAGLKNLSGQLFDMIHPDISFRLEPKAAIYTTFVIEQLGGKFQEFVSFLLENKPAICVHMEPTAEVYDLENLVDYLSYRFHTKRHYSTGFLPLIEELHKQNKAELIKVRRLYFGNLNMEGYTLIVWKPL